MTNGYRLVREPKGKTQVKVFLQIWASKYGDTYHTWTSFKRNHHIVPVGDGINIKVRKIRTDVGKLRKSRQLGLSDYAHQPTRHGVHKSRWQRFYGWAKGLLWGSLVLLLVLNFTQIFGTPIAHADEGLPNSKVSEPREYVAVVMKQKEVKPTNSNDVLTLIEKASKEYGVDYDLMRRIAYCESRYNPNAKNKSSTASGLYQHIKATWIGHRKKMGLSTDLNLRFDAYESARTTAWSISQGGLRNWNASKSCWN